MSDNPWFDLWLMEVARLTGSHPYAIKANPWKRYYDEGYSPREAVAEEEMGEADDF